MVTLRKLINGLLLAVSILAVSYTGNSQSDRMKDKFYIGAINYLWPENMHNNQHLGYYNNLSYNLMHSYSSHADTTKTEAEDGGFLYDVFPYLNNIINIISIWNNSSSSAHSLIFEREKVLRPAYGQRSTYEAEINYVDLLDPKLFPKYGFDGKNTVGQICYDNSIFGNGIRIKKCIVGQDDPGFIVKDLYENCEQVNRNDIITTNKSDKRMFSDLKQPNYEYKWYIKPRMRIEADYAIAHPEDIVAILYVNNFDGNLITSFTIKCKNFMQFYEGTWYYDGRYIEMYYQLGNDPINNDPTAFSVSADDLMVGRVGEEDWHNSLVDYYIEWKGNVNTYLDYIRVDDEWAHALFTETSENPSFWNFHQKINEEIDSISNRPGFGYFWVDEFAYNNLPCVKEVNNLIRQRNQNTSFVTPANIDGIVVEKSGLRSTQGYNRLQLIDEMINNNILTNIFLDGAYPFLDSVYYPQNLNLVSGNYLIFNHMNHASTNEEYNCGNGTIKGIQEPIQNWALYACKENRRHINDLTYGYMLQVHSDEAGAADGKWALREPTNEEIRVQCYLGLALGAKLIVQYSYYSHTFTGYYEDYYSKGLNEFTYPRYTNYYGQAKWDSVVVLNQKIRTLGDIMYPPGQTLKPLIYDKTVSVNLGEFGNDYIQDIKSKIINMTGITKYIYDPVVGNIDSLARRYWEIGFFKPNLQNPDNPIDKGKYFLAVNKRCAPVANGSSDERNLYIKFDAQYLPVFNNWKLIDALTNTEIFTFNKNSTEYINAGRFLPGEGKLFKLAPVLQEGGDLVCDEAPENVTVLCKAKINTNGFEFSPYNCNIKFKDGVYINADQSDLYIYNCTLEGFGSEKWDGLFVNNANYCYINGNTIKDIDTLYALDIINSLDIEIVDNTFNFNYSHTSDVNSIRINNTEYGDITGVFILNNHIYLSKAGFNIYVMMASLQNDEVYINNNIIISQTNDGDAGIILSGISNGNFEDNYISGFLSGVLTLNSNINYWGNTITLSRDYAKCIYGVSNSNAYLGSMGENALGGNNTLISDGYSVSNIKVSNSTFYLNDGYNIFSVPSDADPDRRNYHLSGYFPSTDEYDYQIFESNNCFKLNLNKDSSARSNVTKNENPVNFAFIPYHCSNGNEDLFAVDYIVPLNEIYSDTAFKIINQNSQQLSYPQQIYRQINKNIKKRNFDSAAVNCTNLLTNYADSVNITDVIPKLYLSIIKTDTSQIKMQWLKSFYEMLILNHSTNTQLVKSAFYQIQKCKVYLEQYTSALAGFEEIITQNPYSYEGLVASWDYAATVLQMDTTHISGGFKDDDYFSFENSAYKDSLRMQKMLNTDNYDIKSFTKENRKAIFTNARDVFTNEKEKQNEIVKKLEEKSKNGDLKASVELVKMKTLKEVVKTNRPKTTTEYVNIINDNINKVFKSNTAKGIKTTVSIPTTFQLYQNYPNPFNPTTKISFDLPKDLRVTIMIFDILGREVTKIINNEFRTAGKYITEFNASALSSGIYFYQIRAGEFIQAKKMLIVK